MRRQPSRMRVARVKRHASSLRSSSERRITRMSPRRPSARRASRFASRFSSRLLAHLVLLHLRVGVGVLHELRAALPAEDDADEQDREADVERRRDELLAERVRGRRGVVRVASSANVLNAWFTPIPPGVKERMFASWFEPSTLITEPNVTGMPYAARNTTITIDLRRVAAHLRQQHQLHVRAEVAEDRGALHRLRPHLLDPGPEEPKQEREEEDRAGDDPERRARGGSRSRPARCRTGSRTSRRLR